MGIVKTTDLWATPQPVFDYWYDKKLFSLDICANKHNAKMFPFISEKEDAFTVDFSYVKGRWVWCNPPYSNVMPWIDLAIKNQALDVYTVMLVKHDCSTKWWSKAYKHATEICEVMSGRLSFLHPEEGKGKSGNNFASVFLLFGDRKVVPCCEYPERTVVTKDELMKYQSGK